MVLGAFAAIGQTNIKRLMAYSSIGHIGYALVGLAAGSDEGVRGVLIYLVIYMAMTLGAFAFILPMRRKDGMVEDIDDWPASPRPISAMAFVLAILMFSLAGIPPLAGFLAKCYVFLAAVEARLCAARRDRRARQRRRRLLLPAHRQDHVLRRRQGRLPAGQGKVGFVMALAGLFVLFYVVYPAPLVDAATAAAKALR